MYSITTSATVLRGFWLRVNISELGCLRWTWSTACAQKQLGLRYNDYAVPSLNNSVKY